MSNNHTQKKKDNKTYGITQTLKNLPSDLLNSQQ